MSFLDELIKFTPRSIGIWIASAITTVLIINNWVQLSTPSGFYLPLVFMLYFGAAFVYHTILPGGK